MKWRTNEPFVKKTIFERCHSSPIQFPKRYTLGRNRANILNLLGDPPQEILSVPIFAKKCLGFLTHATSMLSRFGHLEGILIFFQFFSWIDNIDFEQLRVSSEMFWELILLSEHILWCQSIFWCKITTIKSKTTQEKTFFFNFWSPKFEI